MIHSALIIISNVINIANIFNSLTLDINEETLAPIKLDTTRIINIISQIKRDFDIYKNILDTFRLDIFEEGVLIEKYVNISIAAANVFNAMIPDANQYMIFSGYNESFTMTYLNNIQMIFNTFNATDIHNLTSINIVYITKKLARIEIIKQLVIISAQHLEVFKSDLVDPLISHQTILSYINENHSLARSYITDDILDGLSDAYISSILVSIYAMTSQISIETANTPIPSTDKITKIRDCIHYREGLKILKKKY